MPTIIPPLKPPPIIPPPIIPPPIIPPPIIPSSITPLPLQTVPVNSSLQMSMPHGSHGTNDCDKNPVASASSKGLALWVFLYFASGVAQPLLTDAIKYRGGTGGMDESLPPTMLPVLANTLGMFSVPFLWQLWSMLSAYLDLGFSDVSFLPLSSSGSNSLPLRNFKDLPWHILMTAIGIDLLSAVLVTSGLLLVGSGMYTVIYSSTTVWTAIISYLSRTSVPNNAQWLGIATVSLGLLVNGAGVYQDAKFDTVEHAHSLYIGVILLLAGTVCHAGAFVYNERAIRGAGVSPVQLCARIGGIELLALLVYNCSLVVFLGLSPYHLYLAPVKAARSTMSGILFMYALLVVLNGLHAMAFFVMLSQLGALTVATIKGALSASTFSFAAVFFCRYEASQCFTLLKTASMLIVIVGSTIYVNATQQLNRSSTLTNSHLRQQ